MSNLRKGLTAGGFVAGLGLAFVVGFGSLKYTIKRSRINEYSKEMGIRVQLIDEYTEAGVKWWYSDSFFESGITPKDLKFLLNEEKLDYDALKDFAFPGHVSYCEAHENFHCGCESFEEQIKKVDPFWSRYKPLKAAGFSGKEALDYMVRRISPEKAIKWKGTDERFQELIHTDITLERAEELLEKYDVNEMLNHLMEGRDPDVLDTALEKIPDYRGYIGRLNKEAREKLGMSLEEYRKWISIKVYDHDIRFCLENKHTPETVKKWKEERLSIKEMHKSIKTHKLLHQN